MVVHTPSKLDGLRHAAAVRRAAVEEVDGVPPSVLAAGQLQDVSEAVPNPDQSQRQVQDQGQDPALGRTAASVHDFDVWTGNTPPGLETLAEVDVHRAEGGEDTFSNVTTRKVKDRLPHSSPADTKEDDTDKISIAEAVSDVTPPPPPTSFGNPQLNPFTPEWFQQLIGAAVSAAATAVAAAPKSSPSSASASASSAPRRLNDRKVPDFWEDKPDFWFRIFDAHLSHFNPSESKCFDALLPLLTPAARATVHSLIRTPGRSPYSKAREVLLRRFGCTPHQMAREFRDTRSLGDRLPSELVDHLRSLVPDFRSLLEVVLLDSLPSNARDAALQQPDLEAMMVAADQVILGNRALAAAESSVNALSLDDSYAPTVSDDLPAVAAVSRGGGAPASRSGQDKKSDRLCLIHARYGKEAYRCLKPSYCRMRHITRPRPASQQSSSSGNGPAGGRQ